MIQIFNKEKKMFEDYTIDEAEEKVNRIGLQYSEEVILQVDVEDLLLVCKLFNSLLTEYQNLQQRYDGLCKQFEEGTP